MEMLSLSELSCANSSSLFCVVRAGWVTRVATLPALQPRPLPLDSGWQVALKLLFHLPRSESRQLRRSIGASGGLGEVQRRKTLHRRDLLRSASLPGERRPRKIILKNHRKIILKITAQAETELEPDADCRRAKGA